MGEITTSHYADIAMGVDQSYEHQNGGSDPDDLVSRFFDFHPAKIIEKLDLRRPISIQDRVVYIVNPPGSEPAPGR